MAVDTNICTLTLKSIESVIFSNFSQPHNEIKYLFLKLDVLCDFCKGHQVSTTAISTDCKNNRLLVSASP
jgi:hypothetical protein